MGSKWFTEVYMQDTWHDRDTLETKIVQITATVRYTFQFTGKMGKIKALAFSRETGSPKYVSLICVFKNNGNIF